MAHPINMPEHSDGFRSPVTSQWYRAPEVLLGSKSYGLAIDIWSAACIFGQFLQEGRVLFKGQCFEKPGEPESIASQKAQMTTIWSLCGTPNAAEWPRDMSDAIRHSFSSKINRDLPYRLAEQNKTPRMRIMTAEAIKLLDRMLQLVPERRPTAAQVLESDYFAKERDPAYRTEELPSFSGHHMSGHK